MIRTSLLAARFAALGLMLEEFRIELFYPLDSDSDSGEFIRPCCSADGL
ncbi:hypothetical protein [Nocardia niigatensis]|nr:hypothetical protein [Nocardia niigatensis]